MTITTIKTLSPEVKIIVQSYVKGKRTMYRIILNDVGLGKTGYARKYDAIAQAKRYIEYYGDEKLIKMYEDYKNK